MNRRGMMKTAGAFFAGLLVPFGGARIPSAREKRPGVMIDVKTSRTYQLAPCAGFFTLSFGDETTPPIAFNATQAEIDKVIADTWPPTGSGIRRFTFLGMPPLDT